ncbi:hypothetical protein BD626DRAFT_633647 [Schizophyllum amplum]|uniref:F-box domain-containing protein n=1 Tax=Schizophyllum amplum TaxID=97359 RepID=A0A550C222_9AGAR|nr:hypothetical protein BD626DRAFT_633647 [Auriculariopsis ampla]
MAPRPWFAKRASAARRVLSIKALIRKLRRKRAPATQGPVQTTIVPEDAASPISPCDADVHHEFPEVRGDLRSGEFPADETRDRLVTDVKRMDGLLNQCWNGLDDPVITLAPDPSAKRKRASLQSRQKDYLSLLAPVRRLPDELLIDVFIYVLAAAFLAELVDPLLELNKLGAVCTHWNVVSRSSAKLQTFLSISAFYSNSNSPRLPRTLDALSGAGDLPVHLKLVCFDKFPEERQQQIIARAPQTQTLYMAYGPTYDIPASTICWPAVTTLKLFHFGVQGHFTEGCFPALRHVALDSVNVLPSGLPYGQLDILEITGHIPKIHQLLHALGPGAPHALHLRVSPFQTTLDYDVSAQPTVLTNLQSLHVSADEAFARALFTYAAAPRLRALELCTRPDKKHRRSSWGVRSTLREFVGFLRYAGAGLRRLALDVTWLAPDSLSALLQRLPTVTQLRLGDAAARAVNDALLRDLAGGGLLPRLRELRLSGEMPCSADAVLDMLDKRRAGSAALARVSVEQKLAGVGPCPQRLLAIAGSGLDLMYIHARPSSPVYE